MGTRVAVHSLRCLGQRVCENLGDEGCAAVPRRQPGFQGCAAASASCFLGDSEHAPISRTTSGTSRQVGSATWTLAQLLEDVWLSHTHTNGHKR